MEKCVSGLFQRIIKDKPIDSGKKTEDKGPKDRTKKNDQKHILKKKRNFFIFFIFQTKNKNKPSKIQGLRVAKTTSVLSGWSPLRPTGDLPLESIFSFFIIYNFFIKFL